MAGMSYEEEFNWGSSVAQVFPRVVMTMPDMLTKTATTLAIFKESSPSITPTKRVNNPDVEDSTVVLATLVCSSAAFDRYCRKNKRHR